MADILIMGGRIEIPKAGESYIDIRIYETGEIVIDGDQDKSAKAIELPPHGVLKDVDEIAQMIISKPCNSDSERLNHIYDCIAKARTILEANNGSDN